MSANCLEKRSRWLEKWKSSLANIDIPLYAPDHRLVEHEQPSASVTVAQRRYSDFGPSGGPVLVSCILTFGESYSLCSSLQPSNLVAS